MERPRFRKWATGTNLRCHESCIKPSGLTEESSEGGGKHLGVSVVHRIGKWSRGGAFGEGVGQRAFAPATGEVGQVADGGWVRSRPGVAVNAMIEVNALCKAMFGYELPEKIGKAHMRDYRYRTPAGLTKIAEKIADYHEKRIALETK